MAKRKCPGCGTYYLGKRCPECYYTPFDGEETAGIHDFHRDSPEIVREKPRGKTPGRKMLRPVVIILAILLVTNLGGILLSVTESVISNLSHSMAEPEPIPIPIPEDGLVLHDGNGIRVILGWNGGEITGDIPVYLENNSQWDVTASTNGVSVNNRMTDNVFFYVDARRGTTSMSQLWIDPEEMKNLGIGEIAEISLMMDVMEDDSYSLLNEPELITFGPGGTILSPDILGEPLVKNEEFLLVFQETGVDAYGDIYLQFYAENRTGEIRELSSSELVVNGASAGQYLWQRFFPDTGAVIRVELYEAESLGIKTPEDIESLELSITTVDENWETRTESDTIVLQLEK